jgi:hypothetical protein
MVHHTIETPDEFLDGVGQLPGLVPDPLFEDTTIHLGPNETQSFWISLEISKDVTPGSHDVQVHLNVNATPVELVVPIDVAPVVLEPRRDFPVTHWFRVEAIWDYYQTGTWEDPRLWQLLEAYLRNYAQHGNDTVIVPAIFDRRELFKRPSQALIVTSNQPGEYQFEWKYVQRFVDLAKKCGIDKFEWPHFWLYWGAEHPAHVYTFIDGNATLLWPETTKARDEVFITFLKQFLPEFHAFLKKNEILDRSYFHLSDEPQGDEKHLANYRANRQVLRDLAPWMKVMDALSDIRYGREGLTDMPIPLVDSAQAFIDEKIPHWVYFCCLPRGKWLNRFMDTPLSEIGMSGSVFYKLNARGFLHWGYNYWHFMESENITDPFTMATGGAWPNIPHGDPFVVYPGKDGPLDSIRWEVFAESLQDYAILQQLKVARDDAGLAEIRRYDEFPRTVEWLTSHRRSLLTPREH